MSALLNKPGAVGRPLRPQPCVYRRNGECLESAMIASDDPEPANPWLKPGRLVAAIWSTPRNQLRVRLQSALDRWKSTMNFAGLRVRFEHYPDYRTLLGPVSAVAYPILKGDSQTVILNDNRLCRSPAKWVILWSMTASDRADLEMVLSISDDPQSGGETGNTCGSFHYFELAGRGTS